MNGLGSLIKNISGNLDAEDGKRYNELFEKINENQNVLEKQNLETIRLNKKMTTNFNQQIETVRYNEIILKNKIIQLDGVAKKIADWQCILHIKDILNELIFLTINLIEIVSEIEISLSLCSLNKIHNSIITLNDLKNLTCQVTNVDFWDLSSLVTSHCRIQDTRIEYLLEMPIYVNNKEQRLLQITPIPIQKIKKYIC